MKFTSSFYFHMDAAKSIFLHLPPLTSTFKSSDALFPIRSERFGRRRKRKKISAAVAVDEISTITSDPNKAEITWQIVVGSIAGFTPFVVAGIEFSKRIVAQKRCGDCGGSGLVLMEKQYIRCPSCGGFLPWQSWKRFFSG